MHLKPSIDIIQFLEQTAKCQGEVLFTTTEGDRINLKSTLSRYVFIFLSSCPDTIADGLIVCSDNNDLLYLENYLQKV